MKRSSLVPDQAYAGSDDHGGDGRLDDSLDDSLDDPIDDTQESGSEEIGRNSPKNSLKNKSRKNSRSDTQSPRNAAMNLLARREHSFTELQRKLARRFDKHELDVALTTLSDENLQSDQRFAQSFTRERMLRGIGPLRIESELRQRGVQRQLIDEALAFVPEEEGVSWRAVAEDVLHRKFGDEPPEDIAQKAKRLRFLAYRGFGEESTGLVPDVRYASAPE